VKTAKLWRISVTVTPESEEAVGELLDRIFGQAASIYRDAETGATQATVYLESPTAWSARRKIQLRVGLDRIRDCGLETGNPRISARQIRREDWAESWKRHFKPFEIGTRLLVRPTWSRRRAKPGQAVVVLDPGLSFGTGQHPTTRFCLEQVTSARIEDTGQSLLDIGTGSGILAIGAAKLGYGPVEAFDFDPEAVRIARANARQNNLRFNIYKQDLTRLPRQPKRRFDVVCANLIHDLLIAERSRITDFLKPPGLLVLAGILATQYQAVRRAYLTQGFRLVARRRENEWESGAFVRI
jgi:ribosomal protein L11 methyltransferase